MKKLSILFILYILFSCAQKGALETPLDGLLDLVIDSTYPAKKQVNVNTDSRVYIKFNESMDKESVEKSTVFYPFMNRYKVFKWKNSKELFIEVDTTLKEDFVHFVNVSSGAKDILGREMEEPVNVIFSTGDTIYENRISGKVFGNNSSNVSKMSLYLFEYIPADTMIFDLNYVQKGYTTSGTDGSYSFDNIKVGNYIILGLKDDDKDGLHSGDELVAVASDTIVITDETDTNLLKGVNLCAFNDARYLYVESIRANYDGLFEIKFNKDIKLTKENILDYMEFSFFDSTKFNIDVIDLIQFKDKKTYNLYFKSNLDTAQNLVTYFKYDSTLFRDSLLSIVDTASNVFEFRYYPNLDTSSLVLQKFFPVGVYSATTNLRFRFNRVLKEFDKENMEMFLTREIDTSTIIDTLNFRAFIDKNDLVIAPQIDSLEKIRDSKLTFTFLPNAVFDVKNITNKDSIVQDIVTPKGKKGGTLDLLIKSNQKGEYLIVVLKSRSTNQFSLYKTSVDSTVVSINYIPEDYYSVMAYYGNQNEQIEYNSIYSKTPFCQTIFTGNDSLKIRDGWSTLDTIYGY